MATLQVRIDKETKEKARKIFKELGMNLSEGIKLFLKQVVIRNKLPFEVLTENGFSAEQEDEILTASQEAKEGKNIEGPFKSAEEFIESLNND